MAFPWRNRKSGLKTKLDRRVLDKEITVPTHFRCPISLELMKDPVTASTGITYDRQSIETWLEMGNATCPVTKQELRNADGLLPNHAIRKMIQDWCVANRRHGIERIPTPKIPVTRTQVVDILSEVAAAGQRGDHARCRQMAAKVRNLARESERNRRCFASNGASRVLAATFGAVAGGSSECSAAEVSEEILAALATVSPLDEEAASHIGSPESLGCLASILTHGNLAARLSAALVVKQLLASSGAKVDAVAGTKGLVEALAKLVKEPIFPQATKASLVAIFYMVSHDERTAAQVVDLGLVPVLVEALVEPEKSMNEKALAVLEGLLSCEGGREKARQHALTVPVLVKKMFRVSDMATELVVSALWKLCRNEGEEGEGKGRCLQEALRVGAFQKLLLLLQVGCSGETKEKATDLIKQLDGHREAYECVDTMDFKGLKKPL
ncbi:U-box domain-containing protein 21 [Musa acuminata AAA Group]|uniref:U-box domain-containing protein 21 n=1 Tax=Musa acuminata AAA Group TaxID=214697 RepID=UPI0031D7A835